jgi:hypothetical protein
LIGVMLGFVIVLILCMAALCRFRKRLPRFRLPSCTCCCFGRRWRNTLGKQPLLLPGNAVVVASVVMNAGGSTGGAEMRTVEISAAGVQSSGAFADAVMASQYTGRSFC